MSNDNDTVIAAAADPSAPSPKYPKRPDLFSCQAEVIRGPFSNRRAHAAVHSMPALRSPPRWTRHGTGCVTAPTAGSAT